MIIPGLPMPQRGAALPSDLTFSHLLHFPHPAPLMKLRVAIRFAFSLLLLTFSRYSFLTPDAPWQS